MPRVNAIPVPRGAASGGRGKRKVAAMPDRLSARAAFVRRLRKSLKPGLWVLGGLFGVLVLPALVRSAAGVPAVGSVGGGFADLAAAAGLRVRHIEIDGADATPQPLIEAALGVDIGAPILGVSERAIAARVMALGPVQSAIVERVLPDTLIVRVVERRPFAIWQQAPGKFVVISRDGAVIADQSAQAARKRDPSLLLVVGGGAPAASEALESALAAHVPVQTRVIAAERVDGLRWNLVLHDHTLVKLPGQDAAQAKALAALDDLQARMQLLDRPVETIDLREPGRMIVKPYPTAAAESGKRPKASGGT